LVASVSGAPHIQQTLFNVETIKQSGHFSHDVASGQTRKAEDTPSNSHVTPQCVRAETIVATASVHFPRRRAKDALLSMADTFSAGSATAIFSTRREFI
jgi:hypothetical protein